MVERELTMEKLMKLCEIFDYKKGLKLNYPFEVLILLNIALIKILEKNKI